MSFTKYLPVALGLIVGMTANASTPSSAANGARTVRVSTTKQVVKKTSPTPKKTLPSLQVQGKIKAITRPPRPRAVPYKEAIIAVYLTDVKAIHGKFPKKEILVFMWGMRDNTWTRAASYRVGQTVTLSLQPWDKVEHKYGGYNRIDLVGDAVFRLEPYWADTN
jgi:hypothetical protein